MVNNKEIIETANKKLKQAVDDGQFLAIKYVLENLDPAFNIEVKELKNSLFEDILHKIDNASFINAQQKINIIDLIKTVFDG